MAHPSAGHVIGARLEHQVRLQWDVGTLLSRPSVDRLRLMTAKSTAAHHRLQLLPDLLFSARRPAAADVVQKPSLVIEPEQEVLDLAAIVLVDPANHRIDRLPDLELLHRALAGLIALGS